MYRHSYTVLRSIFATAFLLPTAAAGAIPSDDPPVYTGSERELAVTVPAVAEEEIRVDGRLVEDIWATAAVLEGFTQYDPVEGAPAIQPTRVRVFFTQDALHFGIEATDTEPEGIRATLAERDNVGRSDDWVRIILDTFNDQRRAYAFTVNPLGVQEDGLWVEGSGGRGGYGDPIDDNPDFIWESEGIVHETGWTVEVRIPFKSLRFPQDRSQTWGLNVVRRIQRTGYTDSWAPLTANVANKLAQAGRLEGLRDLEAGRLVEFNPVVTASRVGLYDEAAGGLVRENPEGEFGMNMTFGVTSNLTLDATYNPDFSQVEADAGQIVVNERFAQFFPEKRPFFLEGTEIFALPRQLIYTRSIVNPVGGAKLTGKVGSFNVGYLGAVDEVSGADNVTVNLMRVRRDVGGSSTVGAVYTDRTRSGSDFNRVAGADARIVFAERYTLSLLGAMSWDGTPGVPETSAGSMIYGQLQRSGRRFSAQLEFEDTEAAFRPESGFIRRLGESRGKAEARLNFYGDRGALLEQVRPFAEVEGIWDRDAFWKGGAIQELDTQLGLYFGFRGNISVFGTWNRSLYDFAPDRYEGLFSDAGTRPFVADPTLFRGLDRLSLRSWVRTWERVQGSLGLNWSEQPIFAFGAPVELARSLGGDVGLTLIPTPAFRTELGMRFQSLTRELDGSEYSTALIPRIRMQYQFSKSLFLRGVFEYAAQERGTPVDPVTGEPLQYCGASSCRALSDFLSNDIHIEGLLSYEPSPGTVFFLGYSRDMEEADAFRFQDVRPNVDGLFLKVSYRFRL
ncbi:MAG: carbohydrate binding family 9 domain-containing protein [Gemmatimonadales bacterium]|jgi:hypothetical protein|nr:MAG: carbohydrate binding family 9 domain-containing protein [Gemmatimonadales bacterium]